MTRVIRHPKELRTYVEMLRRNRITLGFLPTMGALHEGHLANARRSYDDNDRTVVSVYVNPLQFGPGEDLDRYPRDLEGDVAKCASSKVDVVFAPSVATMQPPGRSTNVHVAGLSHDFEGAIRPGHFDGVATIVARLLNLVQPDRVYFGQKDYQQTVVVRRMVEDLAIPVEVVVCPTIRDADGLALSSRNRFLKPGDREEALRLPRALERIERAALAGVTDCDELRAALSDALASPREDVNVDYAEIVHPATMAPLGRLETHGVALAALRVGATRLIDNRTLTAPGATAWEM